MLNLTSSTFGRLMWPGLIACQVTYVTEGPISLSCRSGMCPLCQRTYGAMSEQQHNQSKQHKVTQLPSLVCCQWLPVAQMLGIELIDWCLFVHWTHEHACTILVAFVLVNLDHVCLWIFFFHVFQICPILWRPTQPYTLLNAIRWSLLWTPPVYSLWIQMATDLNVCCREWLQTASVRHTQWRRSVENI